MVGPNSPWHGQDAALAEYNIRQAKMAKETAAIKATPLPVLPNLLPSVSPLATPEHPQGGQVVAWGGPQSLPIGIHPTAPNLISPIKFEEASTSKDFAVGDAVVFRYITREHQFTPRKPFYEGTGQIVQINPRLERVLVVSGNNYHELMYNNVRPAELREFEQG